MWLSWRKRSTYFHHHLSKRVVHTTITLFMAGKGFEVYGIDIIPKAISWAEEKKRELSTNADFRIGSVVNLKSYPNGFFDFVFDGSCFHCIIGSDRKSCLGNVFRVLKQGGLFYVEANIVNEKVNKRFDMDSNCYFDPQSQCLMHGDVPYYYLSREREFLNEVREAGFQIVHLEKNLEINKKQPFQAGWLSVDAIKP